MLTFELLKVRGHRDVREMKRGLVIAVAVPPKSVQISIFCGYDQLISNGEKTETHNIKKCYFIIIEQWGKRPEFPMGQIPIGTKSVQVFNK